VGLRSWFDFMVFMEGDGHGCCDLRWDGVMQASFSGWCLGVPSQLAANYRMLNV
jgi:hypothetical protein